MREIIARGVSVLTVAVVLALSLLFAAEHNPPGQPKVVNETPSEGFEPTLTAMPAETNINSASEGDRPSPPISAEEIERGRAVYAAQKCTTCHSIQDEGNPRNPLDGVGARWDAAELREWTTGMGVAAAVLSPAITKRKQRFRSMPEQDLNALVAYLSSLVAGRQPTETDGTEKITP